MAVRRLRLIHSPTADWEAMRTFYRDTLQLPETGGWDLPGDRGAFLSAGTAEIEVMEQDVRALGIVPHAAAPWRLALEVPDVDAEFHRLRTLAVPVLREVSTHPWGAKDFVITDPAGNPILIFQQPGG